ncbi:MAG: hypothetical protein HC921_14700, partial [Synechococcaceae cyanobacterium SM2_3_1]|nr:hypothetical protein [Synechococcaceae cyanobacterium SM2_3_1]
MTLPPELKRQFREELEQYEAEVKMPLISSMEELAKEEGIQIGKQEGIQIGKQEGIQIGEERGIQIGKQEGIQRVALNMLRQGMSIDQIVSLTQLSTDQVEQLLTQIEAQ